MDAVGVLLLMSSTAPDVLHRVYDRPCRVWLKIRTGGRPRGALFTARTRIASVSPPRCPGHSPTCLKIDPLPAAAKTDHGLGRDARTSSYRKPFQSRRPSTLAIASAPNAPGVCVCHDCRRRHRSVRQVRSTENAVGVPSPKCTCACARASSWSSLLTVLRMQRPTRRVPSYAAPARSRCPAACCGPRPLRPASPVP